MPNAPKKPRSAMDTSYSAKKKMSRQKYLLMQLLHVEEQIAKKKKRRLKTAKV